jgi:ankyrin repeat protein
MTHAANPMEALAGAIAANDSAAVAAVIARFPAIRERLDEPLPGGHFGATALLTAVGCGSREIAELLLDAGANVNQRSHWWAGGFGVLDGENGLTEFLIARGATVDAHAAARLGRLDRLRELAAADPGVVHARGGDGQTPLHFAATVEVARFLLDHGADIDARDVDHESTPAQWMIRDRQHVARFLVEQGCAADILMAAALGSADLVRRHLADEPHGVLVSVSAEHFPMRNPRAGGHIYTWTLGAGKTAHLVARDFGHEAIYRLLLRETPLDLQLALACETGDHDTLRDLLAVHPDLPRQLSGAAQRRLADAARDDNAAAVRRFLECGWPVAPRAGFPTGDRGQHGASTLHWAAWHGNSALVREIVARGADLEARDDDFGATPLGWALHASVHGWHSDRGDYADTIEALLDAGAALPGPIEEIDASRDVLAVLRRRATT